MNPWTVLPFFQAGIVLSLIIFIVGMIRPDWVFFWMKEPSRTMVVPVSMILFMLCMVGYGETRKKIDALEAEQNRPPAAAAEQPQ